MRHILSIALIAAGCTVQADTIAHQADIEAAPSGVAVFEGGEQGMMGMFGTTCLIHLDDGMIGEDFDYPTDDEEVLEGEGEDRVLVRAGEHVFVGTLDSQPLHADGPVIDAGASADDIVALAGDAEACAVRHLGADTEHLLDRSWCTAGEPVLAVADDGRAWVGASGEVLRIDAAGSAIVDDEADRIAWDDEAERLYLGVQGSSWLRARDARGDLAWEVELPGSLLALERLGNAGRAAALVATDDGATLLALDGQTGAVTDRGPATRGQELATSPEGDVIVIERAGSVAIHRIGAAP